MFKKIAIIGTGNIGTWLYQNLKNQDNLSVISISGRKIEALPNDFDLYVFALKDDVYEMALRQIPFKMRRAVHTSGSLSQQILAPYSEQFGVVYPYQTITKDEKQKEKEVPVCIEGCNFVFEDALFNWSKLMFNNVCKVSEHQRFAMHLAAVFANNFTNVMYSIAYNIFKENNLDWSLIFPILENTLEKAKHNDPHLCQTGPAKRGDIKIMEKHCNALKDEDLHSLYRMISRIIGTP